MTHGDLVYESCGISAICSSTCSDDLPVCDRIMMMMIQCHLSDGVGFGFPGLDLHMDHDLIPNQSESHAMR